MQPSKHAPASTKPCHKEVYHNSSCEASKQRMQSLRNVTASTKPYIKESQPYSPTPDRALSPLIVPIPHITIISRLSWPPFVQLSHITHSPLKLPSYTLTAHDPTSCHAYPYARPRYRQACLPLSPVGFHLCSSLSSPSGVT
ncbi:hypothetical protein AMTRI_Chr06g195860 [Amborella trichopoda]